MDSDSPRMIRAVPAQPMNARMITMSRYIWAESKWGASVERSASSR
jgi:hypothetical protein